MENITIGQIKDVILFLTALFGGIGILYGLLMKGISKLLEPINEALKTERQQRIKSDLTTFMYLAEKDNISEEQKQLAHEEYDEYIKNGGNSFIKNKFDELVKEHKI